MALPVFFFYMAQLEEQDNDDQEGLSIEDRRRRDRRVPRIAMRRHGRSTFRYLLESGNDQALLNCCAVDHATFHSLLSLFAPVYDRYTMDDSTNKIKERGFYESGLPIGRRRDLDAIGCLGFILYWYRTRGAIPRGAGMAFGLTSTVAYRWLKFGRRVLLYVLQKHPDARVIMPTGAEVEEYIDAIGRKYPLIGEKRVWGAVDGLKLHIEVPGSYEKQSWFYNGWTGGCYVNSVFCFAPDGKIRMALINAPGSWHDSTMASYGLYDRMKAMYDRYGARLVVDSAFQVNKNEDYLIKSSQNPAMNATADEILLHKQATSVRQMSEWGMRMIQGQFPRLKDNLRFEDFGERRIILHLMVLLYNYQTTRIGINTILNSYMSRTQGFGSYSYRTDGRLQPIEETANLVFDNGPTE